MDRIMTLDNIEKDIATVLQSAGELTEGTVGVKYNDAKVLFYFNSSLKLAFPTLSIC